jgi:hypothetical protein
MLQFLAIAVTSMSTPTCAMAGGVDAVIARRAVIAPAATKSTFMDI